MGVPHTPEGAQEGDLLGPASSPGPGVLLLIEDTQLGDTATAPGLESVPRVQPGRVTVVGGDHITV